MFAVDHAATALVIKRRFPSLSIVPLLISVQAMELAWVVLNYLGIEHTTTSATVRSVADIQLADIRYSHSVAIVAVAALGTWGIIERGFGRRLLGRAVAIGIVSHLILDILTHGSDIALWPGSPFHKLGIGLYSGAPSVAFAIELLYGVMCWWIYRGTRTLAAVIVLGNLANISFFFDSIPGPEQLLAGRPLLVVTVIFIQIVTMLVLVGVFSSRSQDRAQPERPRSRLQATPPRRGLQL
ncbi:MAG TPA: hypothetical protein VGF24_16365 [Vicinamibacterales bacterium]|jgi:membrane-bound metal-dependent hydrolase YbcI (DUF457 family)